MAPRSPAVQSVEEFPEADRLTGFPHPRATQRLFGHEAAERVLAQNLASGRMHHGWLITGPDGIGKATLAYRMARHALADAGERDASGATLEVAEGSAASGQVRALSHPELLVIRRAYNIKDKRFPAVIAVDEVRRLARFLSHTGSEGRWRVVIVDRADELNANAANALLKSLEEPPARTIFLLVSSAPGRLLATLRSRCRVLELAPLAPDALKAAVAQALAASSDEVAASNPTPSEWETLVALAQGSVRRLLSLHAGQGLVLHERIAALVAGLPDVDWGAVHGLGDELGSPAAEQRFELFHELLMSHIAGLVRAATLGEGAPEEKRLAERLIGEARLATWAVMWERVAAGKADTMALNLDRKAFILDTFSRLAGAARGEVRAD